VKKILVIGAGRSSASLIRYLLNNAQENQWLIRVVDRDLKMAEQKVKHHSNGEAVLFDAEDAEGEGPL